MELLPNKLFERVVERSVRRLEGFNKNVGALFDAMSTGGGFSLEDIRHFNGGLFADDEVHRIFVWMQPEVLCNQGTLVFARDDDVFFGVLHSRAHQLWAVRMGTFLGVGNDPRYTPTTCFETFPFPEPTEEQREEIASTARRLDDLRAAT